MAHPIENIMKTTMEELREMVDVNTIIGDSVMLGADTVIVPVSRVSLGFLSGGGEYGNSSSKQKQEGGSLSVQGEDRYPFAGTSVAGLSLTPMVFLTITNGAVKVLPAHYNCTLDRIIEMIPNSIREIERIVKDAFAERGKEQETTRHSKKADAMPKNDTPFSS